MKKALSLLLAAAMMLTLLAGCGPKNPASSSGDPSGSESAEPVTEYLPNLMVTSGPTGVGAAKLMADAENFNPEDPSTHRTFVVNRASVVTDNEAVKNALVSGEADIAAVATNVAASLVNKMEGGIQVLAVNTLGVLYILEKGDAVHSMADLAGKTLYATGQGANPEYILNYLLTENGVDPASVDIQWMTAQEVSAKVATEENAICMLPVPAATALMMKDSGVREAVSLTQAWDELGQGPLPQGCLVARTEYIENNPLTLDSFLTIYAESIDYMSDSFNLGEASLLLAKYGITPNEEVAAAAIPQCNLTFITGTEMKETLENYYQVLFQANPNSIGSAMPYDSFYYGVD